MPKQETVRQLPTCASECHLIFWFGECPHDVSILRVAVGNRIKFIPLNAVVYLSSLTFEGVRTLSAGIVNMRKSFD